MCRFFVSYLAYQGKTFIGIIALEKHAWIFYQITHRRSLLFIGKYTYWSLLQFSPVPQCGCIEPKRSTPLPSRASHRWHSCHVFRTTSVSDVRAKLILYWWTLPMAFYWLCKFLTVATEIIYDRFSVGERKNSENLAVIFTVK